MRIVEATGPDRALRVASVPGHSPAVPRVATATFAGNDAERRPREIVTGAAWRRAARPVSSLSASISDLGGFFAYDESTVAWTSPRATPTVATTRSSRCRVPAAGRTSAVTQDGDAALSFLAYGADVPRRLPRRLRRSRNIVVAMYRPTRMGSRDDPTKPPMKVVVVGSGAREHALVRRPRAHRRGGVHARFARHRPPSPSASTTRPRSSTPTCSSSARKRRWSTGSPTGCGPRASGCSGPAPTARCSKARRRT